MPKVDLYTRDLCVHCQNIKKILNNNNIPFVEHKVDIEISPQELKQKFPEVKTLPVVVVDDNWIENIGDLRQLLLG